MKRPTRRAPISRSRSRRALLPSIAMLTTGILACGGPPAGSNCTPGQQSACACPGGTSGVQVCRGDGSGYDACTGCVGVAGDAGNASDAGSTSDARAVDAAVTDTGTRADQDAPVVTLTTNVETFDPYDWSTPVAFLAAVTDPQGVADITGGVLVDDAGHQVGTFTASGGGRYTLSTSWIEINQITPINFNPPGGGTRSFTAQFTDAAGHVGSTTKAMFLSCNDTHLGASCNDTQCGACDGECKNFSSSSSCGSCTHVCGADEACADENGPTCVHGTLSSMVWDASQSGAPVNCDAACRTLGEVCVETCWDPSTGNFGGYWNTPTSTWVSENLGDTAHSRCGDTLGAEWSHFSCCCGR